jgi:hypothetical protein
LGFHARVDGSWSPREVVYAISDGLAVKVGKCTGHPRARLADLQTGSSRTLYLLAYTGTLTEAQAHRRLWRHRVRAEWFETAAVLALVWDWDFLDVPLWRELRALLPALTGAGVAVQRGP